jgi:FdhD protein
VNRSILTIPVQKVEGQSSTQYQDLLAVEEPLEIRIGARTVSITMRTPGNDFELAAGFLFTEGILQDSRQILRIHYSKSDGNPRQASNSVTVELATGVEIDFERLERHFYTTSSCGVCGKASIEALEMQNCPVLPRDSPKVAPAVIHRLPEILRSQQAVFEHTGGLHAAALFNAVGELVLLREDIGRHNAVDKLIGAEMLANHTPLDRHVILVSGRASFELVQKALMAGIPILAAVGAPSSLAVETAQRFNMTLAGFVRGGRFNIYSGASRIQ